MTILRSRLAALAAFAPVLSDPDFSAGGWVRGQQADDAIALGYSQLSAQAQAFIGVAHATNWIRPFDYTKWSKTAEGRTLLSNADAILSRADARQLSRILTTFVRVDRFVDGYLLDAFGSGKMQAVAQRAAKLLEAME